MIKDELKQIVKNNHVICDISYTEIGKDTNGFPNFKINFIEAPKNFKLIKVFENISCAVLEDLDYKEAVQDEPIKEA